MIGGRLPPLRRAPAVAISLALLAGCAPVQLRKAQLAGARRTACAGPDAPRVRLEKTIDARPDPDALGAIGGRAVGSPDVAGWIDDELAALASPGFSVAFGAEPDAGGARLVLRARILKAYVDALAVTKTAVVVLGVDLEAPNGEVIHRLYRGQHASMNWASGAGEGAGALRDAAAASLEQLRADLERTLHPSRPVPDACATAAPGADTES